MDALSEHPAEAEFVNRGAYVRRGVLEHGNSDATPIRMLTLIKQARDKINAQKGVLCDESFAYASRSR